MPGVGNGPAEQSSPRPVVPDLRHGGSARAKPRTSRSAMVPAGETNGASRDAVQGVVAPSKCSYGPPCQARGSPTCSACGSSNVSVLARWFSPVPSLGAPTAAPRARPPAFSGPVRTTETMAPLRYCGQLVQAVGNADLSSFGGGGKCQAERRFLKTRQSRVQTLIRFGIRPRAGPRDPNTTFRWS